MQRFLCSAGDVALRGRRSSVLGRPTRRSPCVERKQGTETNDAVLDGVPTATRAIAARDSWIGWQKPRQRIEHSAHLAMAEASRLVNVADLDIAQLADVKRQLDQASRILTGTGTGT